MPKPRTTKQPRKIGGMTVAELKQEDFRPMTHKQIGDSLRKFAIKKRK